MARELCGGSLLGQQVTVLGAAFKPDSDDVRDSPALSVAAQLPLRAPPSPYGPEALQNAKARFPELHYEPVLDDALDGAHALLLLTGEKQSRNLDQAAVGARVSDENILDGRNVLNPRLAGRPDLGTRRHRASVAPFPVHQLFEILLQSRAIEHIEPGCVALDRRTSDREVRGARKAAVRLLRRQFHAGSPKPGHRRPFDATFPARRAGL